MAGNDQHSDGRTGATGASNVVPLRPRQWLESEDELVPIGDTRSESDGDGATATRERPQAPRGPNGSTNGGSSPDESSHASAWLGAGEQTVSLARAPLSLNPAEKEPVPETAGDRGAEPGLWAASDFWGEEAASLQHPVEAVAETPDRKEASERRRHRLSALPVFSARTLVAMAVAAVAVVAVAFIGFQSAPATAGRSALSSSLRAATSALAVTRARNTSRAAASQSAAARHSAPRVTRHRRTDVARNRPLSRSRSSHRADRPDHQTTVVATTTAVRDAARPVSTASPTVASDASSPAASPNSAPRAGPTGTISLIGSGTSPSG